MRFLNSFISAMITLHSGKLSVIAPGRKEETPQGHIQLQIKANDLTPPSESPAVVMDIASRSF